MATLVQSCPECGGRVLWSDRFCEACGVDLNEEVVLDDPDDAPRPANATIPPSRGVSLSGIVGVVVAACVALSVLGAINDDDPAAFGGTGRAAMDVGDYLIALSNQTRTIERSLDRSADLTADPRFGAASWVADFEAEIAIWRAVYDEARGMSPPAAWAAFHRDHVAALALLVGVADDTQEFLDTGDFAALDRAGDKLLRFNAAIRDLTARMEAMT